jgi:hypothetical protein
MLCIETFYLSFIFQGMFPYAMLASTTIFYSNDWPKRLMTKFKLMKENYANNGKFLISNLSGHCVYDKMKNEDAKNQKENTKKVNFILEYNPIEFIVIKSNQRYRKNQPRNIHFTTTFLVLMSSFICRFSASCLILILLQKYLN